MLFTVSLRADVDVKEADDGTRTGTDVSSSSSFVLSTNDNVEAALRFDEDEEERSVAVVGDTIEDSAAATANRCANDSIKLSVCLRS